MTAMGGKGKFFVGGNWKCNETVAQVKQLVEELKVERTRLLHDSWRQQQRRIDAMQETMKLMDIESALDSLGAAGERC